MTAPSERHTIEELPMADRAIDSDMELEMVSDLQANAADLLERLRQAGQPVVIAEEGQRSAVLIEAEAYDSLLEELDTLRDVHRGLHDAAQGRVTPHDEARAHLLGRYS